ncbi:TIGR03668 family PPOX class F420-dependent oxidoreductase [Prescottella sp. R16]|uniref:TIGR03668 family PPOX class F420-dependent oxidoreductase n=1 Tax=Prescottella sp. R16 TaxID=3064529 RepID=UPI00272E4591|nr:TIGR03668 family PPOX class F420-dependent oxidoreductase [Prescottella sp. R16]
MGVQLPPRFVAAPVARLATVSADGRPHLVPVVFAVASGTIYSAVDAKPKTTTRLRRLANIAETGRVSLLVDRYDDDWSQLWWVRVDGVAAVLPAGSGEAVEALVAKYPQYRALRPSGPVIAVRPVTCREWAATP